MVELDDILEEGTLTGGLASEDGPSEDGCEEQVLFEHYRFEVDSGQAPIRVDKYLSSHMEGTSRNRISIAVGNEYVKANGKVVKASYKVQKGDIITIEMPYERRGVEIMPQNIPLNVVYEDKDVLVVDKPAGLVVHPGHGHYEGTLVNALAYHFGIRESMDAADERMGCLVHRIDKDTSGLLVVTKNPEAQFRLARQFFVHSIERVYVAVVWGNIKEDSGTIEGNIGRDPSDRLRFKVFPDGSQGKTAVTHFRVLERFGFVTVVECRLETGRTHQIRVHFNYIGHPLFGDDRYDGREIRTGTIYAKYRQFIENCFKICPRQALHARVLGFEHPVSGEHLHFESPVPEDMTALIEKWRRYVNNNRIEE